MTVADICSNTTKIILPWTRSQLNSSILEDTCRITLTDLPIVAPHTKMN